jgi:hypothetical protein
MVELSHSTRPTSPVNTAISSLKVSPHESLLLDFPYCSRKQSYHLSMIKLPPAKHFCTERRRVARVQSEPFTPLPICNGEESVMANYVRYGKEFRGEGMCGNWNGNAGVSIERGSSKSSHTATSWLPPIARSPSRMCSWPFPPQHTSPKSSGGSTPDISPGGTFVNDLLDSDALEAPDESDLNNSLGQTTLVDESVDKGAENDFFRTSDCEEMFEQRQQSTWSLDAALQMPAPSRHATPEPPGRAQSYQYETRRQHLGIRKVVRELKCSLLQSSFLRVRPLKALTKRRSPQGSNASSHTTDLTIDAGSDNPYQHKSATLL